MKTLIIGTGTGGIGDEVEDVLIYDRDLQEEEIEYHCPTIEQLDVRDQASIDTYMMNFGPFDEIVYSAGVSQLKWIQDLNWRDIDKVLDVNVAGTILVATAHSKLFPEHPGVRYAVIVSDAAHTPMRGSISYCVSKAAAEMAVRCMARELAPSWTVVGISPGVVEGTAMTEALAKEIPEFRGWTEDQAREYEGTPPIGRRVTKREVAETVLFALTGPQALNGSILTINGGK
ncbi:oxidoreductase [Microbacterium phage RikSengupta]|nr:oxidoreductase [Microbacterium phage RikSengupta]